MQPQARKEQLTVRELREETLVYDLQSHRAHCLNRTAALVWKHCDGARDVAALAAIVRRELRLGDAEADAAARLALEQLGRRHLLLEAVAPPAEADRLTRRSALRKLAVAAAAALPVVMTLRSPNVARADAQSCAVAGVCTQTANPCQETVGTCIGAPHGSTKAAFPGICVFNNEKDGIDCPGGKCKNGQCLPAECGGKCTNAGSQGSCPNGCMCVGPLAASTGTCMPA